MADEAFVHGPRADFWCSRCEEQGTQTEPVTLPIKAAFCPTCGKKKWLMRVWSGASSNPGVIGADRHAKSQFTTKLLDKDWDARHAPVAAGIEARTKERPSLAVPMSTLGHFGMAAPTGGSRPVDRAAHPVLGAVPPVRPGPGSMRPRAGEVGHR